MKSLVIEKIDSYKSATNKDLLTKFKVMSRMQSYCEGTRLGYIKIRDPGRAGECLLNLQSNFTDKVEMLHYSKEKNVLFASSKDGQFKVWKVPHEWRNKAISEKEIEAEYERRQAIREQKRNQTQKNKGQLSARKWNYEKSPPKYNTPAGSSPEEALNFLVTSNEIVDYKRNITPQVLIPSFLESSHL